MAKELVSIVIPVYNAEEFLGETIESVQKQTYNNWEILLINDCSTDNSKKVYEKYKSRRIKWIDMEKNGGPALARNKGVDLAKGDYLCFLDADDLWKENKLEKQIEFMKENDCMFSFTSYEYATHEGVPTGKKVFVPSKINYKQALKNTIIATSTVMFDLKKIDNREDIHMPNVKSEDTACWWKILKNIDYAYGVKDVLTLYRRSPKTLSSNKFKAVYRTWNLYRKVEKLNFFYSCYCFGWYAFRAVKKRI